ncbi:hypothetical protein M885DRAFT_173605 [Pelagophyceae sp. CCMP2097]|nr:hypothetical protein M885DRAFT_173605 [Pelagophyceae sp. CCMP2097]
MGHLKAPFRMAIERGRLEGSSRGTVSRGRLKVPLRMAVERGRLEGPSRSAIPRGRFEWSSPGSVSMSRLEEPEIGAATGLGLPFNPQVGFAGFVRLGRPFFEWVWPWSEPDPSKAGLVSRQTRDPLSLARIEQPGPKTPGSRTDKGSVEGSVEDRLEDRQRPLGLSVEGADLPESGHIGPIGPLELAEDHLWSHHRDSATSRQLSKGPRPTAGLTKGRRESIEERGGEERQRTNGPRRTGPSLRHRTLVSGPRRTAGRKRPSKGRPSDPRGRPRTVSGPRRTVGSIKDRRG